MEAKKADKQDGEKIEAERLEELVDELKGLRDIAKEETTIEEYYEGLFNGKVCAYDSSIAKLEQVLKEETE